MSRACFDCGGPISRCSKGRCRPCAIVKMQTDPGFEARRVAAIRERYKDPEVRRKAGEEIQRRHRLARKNPETNARMMENLRLARARLNDPDVRATFLAGRPAAGKKRSKTVMAWCPEDKVAEYIHLVRSKKFRAAEAKRIILASLTPFERQMQAVRNGAALVDRPNLSRSYDYTLAGGSPL